MGRPIRILHLSNQAGPLYLFSLPIFQGLRDAGFEVDLACMTMGPLYPPLTEQPYRLHGLTPGPRLNPLTWLRARREVRRLLRRERYDLMVVHTPLMSWAARPVAKGLVGKVVYLAHGLAFAPVQRPLSYRILRGIERHMARYTDAVITMNDEDERQAATGRLTRTDAGGYRVNGEGVDVHEWTAPPSAEETAELEQRLNLRPDRPMILFMGRFIVEKRPFDVIETARRLGDRADVVMAGDGPLWEQIRRQAEALGPHVHVIRFTHQTRALVYRSSVQLLPSVWPEGMPRVLLETQLACRPPVAYNVRGSQDAIVHERTGLLVPPRDVSAFADAVKRLLDDDAYRHTLGEAGRQRVRENYAWEVVAPQHVDIIRKVLEQP